MEGWKKVFTAAEKIEAELARDFLKQMNIESHVLSKQDSNFPMLGEFELMVPEAKAADAEAALNAEGFS